MQELYKIFVIFYKKFHKDGIKKLLKFTVLSFGIRADTNILGERLVKFWYLNCCINLQSIFICNLFWYSKLFKISCIYEKLFDHIFYSGLNVKKISIKNNIIS